MDLENFRVLTTYKFYKSWKINLKKEKKSAYQKVLQKIIAAHSLRKSKYTSDNKVYLGK